MDPLINSYAKCEVRSVIRFLTAKGLTAAEIHRQLTEVYGESVMSEGKVRQWCRSFKEGRSNVHDEDRSGRPSVASENLVERIDVKIRENRRFTITELSEQFPEVSRTVLYELVTKELQYRKVCARWVPKMLTETHKQKRMQSARLILERYERDGDEFLSHIVTGDETWIAYSNVETKRRSMQWRHSDSPKPKKFMQTHGKKQMATVFWDEKGILLVDFLEQGQTVTSERYCQTLRNLRRAIQNKRRGMLSSGIVFLHDNARPHTAHRTVELLEQFKWEIFDHPPYSPDLAPSDYHLFPSLKMWLGSQCFVDNNELQSAVKNWFSAQAADFYKTGIKKLLSRYSKCLERDGDYVEK